MSESDGISTAPAVGMTQCIGRWRVDPRADEIEADGHVVKLEPLMMRLLLALAGRPGEVVLTRELLDTVWAGLIVTQASVYQTIAKLRRTLDEGTDGPSCIETVPRKGYRLTAPVRWIPKAPRAAEPGTAITLAQAAPGLPTPNGSSEADLVPPQTRSADLDLAPRAVTEAESKTSPRRPGRRTWLLTGAALASAGLVGLGFGLSKRAPAQASRIAVLPFTDHSQGGTEQALAQGLAFDVLRSLARSADLDAVAAESVLQAGQQVGRLADLSVRLKAELLLLGELWRQGERLRVGVRVVEMPGEELRWHAEFEQPVRDVAALPERIAIAAAEALHVKLPPGPLQQPTEAYELFVLGEHTWRTHGSSGYEKARGYFLRGIELDPAYAPNYIGAGWMWVAQANDGGGIDLTAAYARATVLFDKALSLAPDSPEAITAQGALHANSGRFDAAREQFERSLKINPGLAQTHLWYGIAEESDGWPQRAVARFQRAADLNPLQASIVERLGFSLVACGRTEPAQQCFRRVLSLNAQRPNGDWGLGVAAFARGDLAQAVSHYRTALAKRVDQPFRWYELGWLYLDLGLPQRALDAFQHTVAQLPRTAWPAILANWAWVLLPNRGQAPPELDTVKLPQDYIGIEASLIRAMAGLSLDARAVDHAVAGMEARDLGYVLPWFAFQGQHSLMNLASLEAALGRTGRLGPMLQAAADNLDKLEHQGNVFAALPFYRARLLALQGQTEGAMEQLDAALKAGWRRAWWLPRDPAFSALRSMARFTGIVERFAAAARRERDKLGE